MKGFAALLIWFLTVGLAAVIFILVFKAVAGMLPGSLGQSAQGVAGRV